MRKSKITKEEKIKWWQGNLFEEDVVELAMTKAYRDLMRTIRSFTSNINNDRIKTNARTCIKEYVNKIINVNITSQKQFDFHYKFERIHPFGDEAESLSKPAIYRKNYCNYKISEMLGNLFLIV